MRRVHWLIEAPLGRRVAARLFRLRLDVPWITAPESPLAVVGGIAPARCCWCTATGTPACRSSPGAPWSVPRADGDGLGGPRVPTRRQRGHRPARRADRSLGVCDDRSVTATEVGPGPTARAAHLPTAAAVVAATALLVALPAAAGGPGRLVAVALLQVALLVAWVPATGIPARTGAPVLGLAAAAGADALLVLPDRPEIGALLAVPGLGLLAAVLHQMLRRAPRHDVVGSLAGVLLLVCAVCALAVVLLPAAGDEAAGTTALLVVGTTLLAGSLVDLVLPRPVVAAGVPRGVPALVLAVLAGAAVAGVRSGADDVTTVLGALVAGLALGAVAALVGLAAGYVVAGGRPRPWAAALLQALLPLAAAAPVAFSLVLQNAV
jgi:hypothetical protein